MCNRSKVTEHGCKAWQWQRGLFCRYSQKEHAILMQEPTILHTCIRHKSYVAIFCR